MKTISFKFLRFFLEIYLLLLLEISFITYFIAITSSANIVDEIHYHDYSARKRRTKKNRSKKYQWHGIANYDHDDEYKKEGGFEFE